MRKLSFLLILIVFACKNSNDESQGNSEISSKDHNYENVVVEDIFKDDSLSIRAIEIMGQNLAFGANGGTYGLFNAENGTWKTNRIEFDSITPEFRAVASTNTDFYMLSVGNPGLLYKTGDTGNMELVYKEDHEKVFYDAMAFWNDKEGIAMGDPTDSCISIIVTRDGGKSWRKLDCRNLPKAMDGEAAFAASNSNIAIEGEDTWILTGGMRSSILYSPDKGKTWEIFETPLVSGKATTGGYSMDFYDKLNGIIIGGDYTDPDGNKANKAITTDGGKTWNLIADGKKPGYKSSVRYVPNSNANEIIAIGFTGIDYSNDSGETWKHLSDEPFYTIRFVNDSLAYAAGKGRISKLKFR